ncbi:DUF2065 domain-containing protein [Thiotrichales bacterium 19S11-10]|nr:DUF2065 domain-containing protein [Thiotrichales bacterium 19S11-10]MCF6807406.1 DUF2065 domain-containing protein [Thiotrichales bacterium 19S9-11]MCF6811375.1 DUF2065 domain-containing protein [Thiotrichales bacterium 19S9-12]
MSYDAFIIAIGIVLVIESLLPSIAPKKYQNFLLEVTKIKPKILRKIALVALLIGLVILISFS